MKTKYEVVNYRTRKLIKQFSFAKDLKLATADRLGSFKIVGINELAFSNVKYVKLKVIDPNDTFVDLIGRRPLITKELINVFWISIAIVFWISLILYLIDNLQWMK